MGSIQEHKIRIKEHLEQINDAIDKGIEQRPVTIGFHCSSCSVELLQLYLHKINAISTGKIVKHNWFERPQKGQKIAPMIERKLTVYFADKEIIYGYLYLLEENRDNLIYGRSTKAQIELVLKNFLDVKELLSQKLKELGETIE
ncbi:hypothetical protein J4232_02090 [Candidatus Woesearchaeota archaeon]|nr:hypothetical protein [Candidatus Woesearchaeota archaeon]